jgi:predicted Zn-dependent protease
MRGNCYEAAAKLLTAHCGCPGVELVHGTVTGQGPIAGVRYGHAWVEVGDVVLDASNGRFVVACRSAYYAVGEVTEPVSRYGFEAAVRQMLETSHYGPWQESL